jgi:hypothetical protein
MEILVGFCEVDFELGPGFVGVRDEAPFLACIGEEPHAEYDGLGIGGNLGSSVWTAACVCEVHGVFELGEERFDGLGGFVGSAKLLIILGKIS